MRRYKAVREFISCLKINDVAIFADKELCKEAFEYDRQGNFYIFDSYGKALSVALGIAMNTDKRVFVFIGDGDCLMEFGVLAQIGACGCRNLFCVLFDNGVYQSGGASDSILKNLLAIKGVFFNVGMSSYELTEYMKTKDGVKQVQLVINNMRGPTAIHIEVTPGVKNDLEEVDYTKKELRNRIYDFIINVEFGTSLFKPPIGLETGGNV